MKTFQATLAEALGELAREQRKFERDKRWGLYLIGGMILAVIAVHVIWP